MKYLFEGCLVGCGVGDALGLPLETLTKAEINEKYDVLTEFVDPADNKYCSHLKAGQYSDDTQLTIAIARSIIACKEINIDDIARKHVEAYLQEIVLRGWGGATRKAVERLSAGAHWTKSGVDRSAGNGAAMKISPVGLYLYDEPEKLFDVCKDIALITHKDPRAAVGSAVVAFAVSYILNQRDHFSGTEFIEELTKYALQCESNFALADENISDKLKRAYDCLNNDVDVVIKTLGNSCYILESVPLSLCMFARKPDDFSGTLIETVNAGGDTDSNGAITGALLGAFNGIAKIPRRWIDKLENHDLLIQLADQLYDLAVE